MNNKKFKYFYLWTLLLPSFLFLSCSSDQENHSQKKEEKLKKDEEKRRDIEEKIKKRNLRNSENSQINNLKKTWDAFSEDFWQNIFTPCQESQSDFCNPRAEINNPEAVYSREAKIKLIKKISYLNFKELFFDTLFKYEKILDKEPLPEIIVKSPTPNESIANIKQAQTIPLVQAKINLKQNKIIEKTFDELIQNQIINVVTTKNVIPWKDPEFLKYPENFIVWHIYFSDDEQKMFVSYQQAHFHPDKSVHIFGQNQVIKIEFNK
ncbi:hypothetical protein [Mesomycoplasma hyorhinis]|uniref:hypothetical protein n=1 Tax=Mesomycoplasma hyorhinis TaxID=2100 RepID=UPI001C0469F8|nr:hypothetical protein [Mesomycoplasma hyorhinis]